MHTQQPASNQQQPITPCTPTVVVAALYKFVALEHCSELRKQILALCLSNKIKGTILVAPEGINGTVSGSRAAIDNLKQWFSNDPDGRFNNWEYKESFAAFQPFLRMKVKLKREIVTLGVPNIDPKSQVGTYVAPTEWNQLINDPNTILVDTRNTYEVDIGTFKGAVNPNTTNFREFPQFAAENLLQHQADPQKKIAMFCTGGIRCEKSTAHLLNLGFQQDQIYHLKGGILNYLQEVPQTESMWEGECFVFDERIAVDHNLFYGNYDQCHGCRHPISRADKQSEQYQPGVHCPHCVDKISEKTIARAQERHKQMLIAAERKLQHLGG
jgi:UPF0176 protein